MQTCSLLLAFKSYKTLLINLLSLDYDMATQRMCVQRGPSDSEDRCADTVYNYKKVFMCFCQGDLCNAATTVRLHHAFGAVLLLTLGLLTRMLITL